MTRAKRTLDLVTAGVGLVLLAPLLAVVAVLVKTDDGVYVSEIVPDKIRLNLAYAAHATVWTDMKVILATLRRLVWSRNGADHAEGEGLGAPESSLVARTTTR